MKTLLFLMRDHTLVPPYHSPVVINAIYHHMRTRREASQQGAALPLIFRQSILGRMQNSYDCHIDTPSLDYFLQFYLRSTQP